MIASFAINTCKSFFYRNKYCLTLSWQMSTLRGEMKNLTKRDESLEGEEGQIQSFKRMSLFRGHID